MASLQTSARDFECVSSWPLTLRVLAVQVSAFEARLQSKTGPKLKPNTLNLNNDESNRSIRVAVVRPSHQGVAAQKTVLVS